MNILIPFFLSCGSGSALSLPEQLKSIECGHIDIEKYNARRGMLTIVISAQALCQIVEALQAAIHISDRTFDRETSLMTSR
jgi:hypothetical protein